MKTLKIIGMVVLAIVVILAIVIVKQPEKAHIEKSIVINATAASIFPEVSNYKNFNVWSPWTKMHPHTFQGTQANVGSRMIWEDSKTGVRVQRIEEVEQNKRVKCAMTFAGYDGIFYSEFRLTPEGNGTRVTWTFDGENTGLKGKAIWAFAGAMLSSQYKHSLQDLKSLVENKREQ
jgi:hypothetical protein